MLYFISVSFACEKSRKTGCEVSSQRVRKKTEGRGENERVSRETEADCTASHHCISNMFLSCVI